MLSFGWSLALGLALLVCQRSRTPARILCLGDSMTASSYGSYPRDVAELCRQKGLRADVISAARPGNTSGEFLRLFKKKQLLLKKQPHIVLLMLGTNDVRIDGDHTEAADFSANIQALIDRLLRHTNRDGSKPRVFLATIPPIFNTEFATYDGRSRERIESEINPAIRRLAVANRIALVDIHRVFVGHPELLPGIHPTAAGYRRMAEAFLGAIEPFL